MKSVETRKAELETRRAQLTQRMQSIDSELDQHQEKDWEELATEREQDEVLEDLGHAAQAEIRMIDAALQRIIEGEYGFCVTCGARIAEERLDVLPGTPFCRDHAAAH
ncbi:TraR/DksA C4-type zinc finger protein [Phaeovulum sp. NW3]|uniref:TraR/DksA family transcriptional regulator n=1 Tax=Phaeovulum sp. NW3 TaxID=2934933 RepID=UPI00201FE977|nr:TraR/DksA C4-type zinc finger protein [Phaeovulum sp. NW3]MCL7465026.1 TraR/DksA C4-type zinc finger protein [Phaeovulum sp. NW3]